MPSLGTGFGPPLVHAGYCTSAGDFVPPQVRFADAEAYWPALPVEPAPAATRRACEDLTAREAAAYLGKEWGTFRNNVKRWGIKKLRTGRYSIKELDRWKNFGKNPA